MVAAATLSGDGQSKVSVLPAYLGISRDLGVGSTWGLARVTKYRERSDVTRRPADPSEPWDLHFHGVPSVFHNASKRSEVMGVVNGRVHRQRLNGDWINAVKVTKEDPVECAGEQI